MKNHIIKFFATIITIIVMEIKNKAIGLTLITMLLLAPVVLIFLIPYFYPHILAFFIAGYLFARWEDMFKRLRTMEIVFIEPNGDRDEN